MEGLFEKNKNTIENLTFYRRNPPYFSDDIKYELLSLIQNNSDHDFADCIRNGLKLPLLEKIKSLSLKNKTYVTTTSVAFNQELISKAILSLEGKKFLSLKHAESEEYFNRVDDALKDKISFLKSLNGLSYDILPYEELIQNTEIYFPLGVNNELTERYGKIGSYFSISSENSKDRLTYLCLVPFNFVESEEHGFTIEKDFEATGKFFAYMTARGFIEESVILNSGIMELGLSGIKNRESYTKELEALQKEGMQSFFENPVINSKLVSASRSR